MILMLSKRLAAATLATATLAAGLTACTPSAVEGHTVVTAFYALEYAAGRVAGDSYAINTLTTPGQEAHDIELTPKQVASLATADLVVYLKGFQPAVDAAVEESGAKNVLDVSEAARLLTAQEGQSDGQDHGELDPHFWLDPVRLADVGDAIAQSLTVQGGDQTALQSNTQALRTDLAGIDQAYRQGLATCERRQFITTHEAFGYLAHAYDLHEIGITGISPNQEPSPARIAEIDKEVRQYQITTIFYEPLGSDALARSIANDLGLVASVLDPAEGIGERSAGKDYPSIMRANLESLRSANGCS